MGSVFLTGSIVVEGHELHGEDLRLMYTFDQATGGTAQFEAHSDAQVFFCSLKDCSVFIYILVFLRQCCVALSGLRLTVYLRMS